MNRIVLALISISPSILMGINGCPTSVSSEQIPGLPANCVEEIVECPYRTWSEADYDPNNDAPDPFMCWEADYSEYAWQESCPDNDPTDPNCGGREAFVEVGNGFVCATCTTIEGEVYEGHPTYLGECDSGDAGCANQAEPPWTVLRVAVCYGDPV
jgi:hypothetical protein